jgi:putative flippase GtrA
MNLHPKVAAGAVAGALTTILMWVLTTFTSVTPTPEVAAAVTTLITLLVSYLTPAPVAE